MAAPRASIVMTVLAFSSVGLLFFQNCGSGFGVMNQAQLQSLSCGDSVQCDGLGFPLGKVAIEQLPPADYPSGSYAPARVESRVMAGANGTKIALVRLADLPPTFACPQTWLRGSLARVDGTTSTELLAGLEGLPCRIGKDIVQPDPLLDHLFNSGCFFIETNYTVLHNANTGAIDLNILTTAVMDEDFSRQRNPTARIRFHCELPVTTAP